MDQTRGRVQKVIDRRDRWLRKVASWYVAERGGGGHRVAGSPDQLFLYWNKFLCKLTQLQMFCRVASVIRVRTRTAPSAACPSFSCGSGTSSNRHALTLQKIQWSNGRNLSKGVWIPCLRMNVRFGSCLHLVNTSTLDRISCGQVHNYDGSLTMTTWNILWCQTTSQSCSTRWQRWRLNHNEDLRKGAPQHGLGGLPWPRNYLRASRLPRR